jgi:regulatory protein
VPRKSSRARAGKPVSAFHAGVRLLADRPHSRAELATRLLRRGYEVDDVESALGTLNELGYIDDASYADGHVRRRSATRGPRAIAAELATKGVEREVVREAVSRIDREAQVLAAMRLVRRSAGGRRPASYEELLDTAGPRLVRRGFSHAIAFAACQAVWADTVAEA